MANSSRLNDWTLANARALHLEVARRTWIAEWLPDWHDYQVTIAISGKKHVGRGLDSLEELAFAKASAEAFERAAMSAFDVPWATAAYPEFAGAAKRAYWELLGIDRVICHHLCRKRFWNLPPEILAATLPLQQLRLMLSNHDLIFSLYELQPAKDARTCAAFIWSGKREHAIKGFVTGFGTDESLEMASEHAAIECLRTAIAVFLGRAQPDKPLKLLRQAGCPSWHLWMAQSSEAMSYLRQYLLPQTTPQDAKDIEDIHEAMIDFAKIDELHRLFPGIPLTVVQAKSDKLIKPQFGDLIPDKSTLRRLEVFSGKPVHIESAVPHFYG